MAFKRSPFFGPSTARPIVRPVRAWVSESANRGQATETRYFLFLPLTKFSLMCFNAFANDLSLPSWSSTFMIASQIVTGLRRKCPPSHYSRL